MIINKKIYVFGEIVYIWMEFKIGGIFEKYALLEMNITVGKCKSISFTSGMYNINVVV